VIYDHLFERYGPLQELSLVAKKNLIRLALSQRPCWESDVLDEETKLTVGSLMASGLLLFERSRALVIKLPVVLLSIITEKNPELRSNLFQFPYPTDPFQFEDYCGETVCFRYNTIPESSSTFTLKDLYPTLSHGYFSKKLKKSNNSSIMPVVSSSHLFSRSDAVDIPLDLEVGVYYKAPPREYGVDAWMLHEIANPNPADKFTHILVLEQHKSSLTGGTYATNGLKKSLNALSMVQKACKEYIVVLVFISQQMLPQSLSESLKKESVGIIQSGPDLEAFSIPLLSHRINPAQI
jgi:hypothetical protein